MSPNLAEKSQRHEKAKMFWASGHRRQILRLEKRKFSQVSKFVWPTSQVCFCRFVRLHSSEARRKIWGWSQKKPCFSFRLKLQTSFLFVFYSNLNQIHREKRKRKGEKHHQMCFFMFPNLLLIVLSHYGRKVTSKTKRYREVNDIYKSHWTHWREYRSFINFKFYN